MSQITTHILDTATGKPAAGVTLILYQQQSGEWKETGKGITNEDGRVTDLLDKDFVLPFGNYKMKFETKEYFDKQLIQTFYPFIEIIFEIKSIEHYHIPLLLNAFGYTTYRGS
jgi:5-hydroxyisourate hydrolase